MPDLPEKDGFPEIPLAAGVPKKQRRLSVVWIIPFVAAVIGGWIAVQKILSEGPKITIRFHSADGLEAGKTKIKYHGVEIGTVSIVTLSSDRLGVVATAEMAAECRDMLVEDTQFWVVRPRISGGTVSGLGTLLSGSYIGMEIGKSKEKRYEFVGLKTPPVVTGEVAGRFFLLKADNLGSLDYGTPLFYRRIQVGQVVGYTLDQDGRSITANIFVQGPYDQYVNPETRFWQASGIDLSMAANGISVHTESLVSLLIGGIAFETPPTAPLLPPAEPDTVFKLFDNRLQAMKPPEGEPKTYVLIFKESVRGLVVGAPVEFSGMPFGEVVSIGLHLDPATYNLSVPVTVKVYPELLFRRAVGNDVKTLRPDREHISDRLIDLGLRAQLRVGNIITGALYVAFDLFPNAPKVKLDRSRTPVELPTVPGDLQEIQQSLMRIVQKFDNLPLDAMAKDLRKALATLDQSLKDFGSLAKRVNADWVPEGKKALAEARRTLEAAERALGAVDRTVLGRDAPVQQELQEALREFAGAARSFRLFVDYLDRHPESLVWGKKATPLPAAEGHAGKSGGKPTR